MTAMSLSHSPLVFLELQGSELAGFSAEQSDPVLHNCALLRDHARASGRPLGFATALRGTKRHHQIVGFEPQRTDMVFDRLRPSCYSSSEFAHAMSASGGSYLLAGFCHQLAALITAIEAASHGHRVSIVEDATAMLPLEGFTVEQSRRALKAIAKRYARFVKTEDCIEPHPNDRAAGSAEKSDWT